MRLTQPDDWLDNMVCCLAEKYKRGEQRQNLFVDMYGAISRLAQQQLIENITFLVMYCTGDELFVRDWTIATMW